MKMNPVTDCPKALASRGATMNDLDLKKWIIKIRVAIRPNIEVYCILIPSSTMKLEEGTLAYKNLSCS